MATRKTTTGRSPSAELLAARDRLLARCRTAASAPFDAGAWIDNLTDTGIVVSVEHEDSADALLYDPSRRRLDPESCDAAIVLMGQLNGVDRDEGRRRFFAVVFELDRRAAA